MLIYFTVGNFLSFYSPQTLSMTAAASCKERLDENTFELNKRRLLCSAVIYGANASGKSNFHKAMQFFQKLVLNSAQDMQCLIPLRELRNLLNVDAERTPSSFEIAFCLNGKEYRYGFEATPDAVVREWLYEGKSACFLRGTVNGEDTIQLERAWGQANGLEARTRGNALFLSVCAAFALPVAGAIVNWIAHGLNLISAAQPIDFSGYTLSRLNDKHFKDKVVAFLHNADMNVEDIALDNGGASNMKPQDGGVMFTRHRRYDSDGNVRGDAYLPFERHESLGTQKAFALAGPVINALENGDVLVVDELDSRLHPIFTRQIVRMFNSSSDNPRHAQLIFNTHDTNLLSFRLFNSRTGRDEHLFRRDQVYFAEKDNGESTHLYSLVEFKEQKTGKKVRNDASFEKDYLNGVYGAVPFIGTLFDLTEASNE